MEEDSAQLSPHLSCCLSLQLLQTSSSFQDLVLGDPETDSQNEVVCFVILKCKVIHILFK